MRAALYARYSTDNQSEASVADQLREARAYATRLGAHVVREFCDEGISGTAMANRPGVQELMAFARRGGCDIIIAEHTNRLSRAGGDGWNIFDDLRAWGVAYHTILEGEVTHVQQGVSSIVSVMQIEDIRAKTRRGLRGRVEAGRSAGGLTFGYSKKKLYDEAGEPVRGHLEIDEAKAEIVRRIFRDYASGLSPLAIAYALNMEGVPSPRGGAWNASTIAGNAKRGNGIIHNELYRGVRVWGRQTFVKDRESGARRGRAAQADPIRKSAPELRIIDEMLWNAACARYQLVSRVAAQGGATRARRPKRFLQGLIVCGECSQPMHRAGPREALRCKTRIEKGLCSNTRTPAYGGIEARVIAAIRGNLLHPAVVEHAIRTVQEAAREARRDDARRQAKASAALAEVNRRIERLVDQVEEGVPWKLLADRHASLEARRAELQAEISAAPAAEVIETHQASASKYRQLIEQLSQALDAPDDPEGHEGREAVRTLIHEVRVTPLAAFGQYELEIVGDLAPILDLGHLANEKGPLAGASDKLKSMAKLGAGTRVTRRHTLSAPFRQVA